MVVLVPLFLLEAAQSLIGSIKQAEKDRRKGKMQLQINLKIHLRKDVQEVPWPCGAPELIAVPTHIDLTGFTCRGIESSSG